MADKERKREVLRLEDEFNVLNTLVVPTYALYFGFYLKLLELKPEITVKDLMTGNLQATELGRILMNCADPEKSNVMEQYGELTCYYVNEKVWKELKFPSLDKGFHVEIMLGLIRQGLLTVSSSTAMRDWSNGDPTTMIAYINERLDLWGKKLDSYVQWSQRACTLGKNINLSKAIEISGNYSYNPGS